MAWVTVNGSKGIWEYENTAVVTDTYKESADGASMSISNGIRTFTKPGTSDTVANYMKCRTVSDSVERGELSKAFYDAVFSEGGGIDTIDDSVTDAATTLQVWFDGADSGHFTPAVSDGDTFTQWTDKSNFAHNANPTGGATTRPTFRSAIQNGKSIVRFDGTNDCLSINPVAWAQSLAGMTVITVSKFSSTSGAQTLTTSDQDDMGIFIDTNYKVTMAGASADSSTAADTSYHIHTLKFDGAGVGNAARLIYRLDGTIFLGCDDSAEFMNGDVAEYLIFNKALSNSEMTNVETYLTTKWGL